MSSTSQDEILHECTVGEIRNECHLTGEIILQIHLREEIIHECVLKGEIIPEFDLTGEVILEVVKDDQTTSVTSYVRLKT